MKLMNIVLFILIMNMMCGVVALIPNPDGSQMFTESELGADSNIYDSSKYNDTTSGDKSEEYSSIFGKFLNWAKSTFNKVYNVLFGFPYLLKQAFPGAVSEGPAGYLVDGINVATGVMWILLLAWLYKGAVIE